LAGIRVNNFDSGARVLTEPSGFVRIHYRMNATGASDRVWGGVSYGYIQVGAAGTYTLTWVMSNQYDWFKHLAAVYIPYEAGVSGFSLVQISDTRVVESPEITCTFPDPL